MLLVIWLSLSLAGAQTPGSLYASFNPTTGPNSNVNALLAQPDGKLIISGPFTRVGIAARKYLVRLNADGTVDTTLNPGIAYPSAPYTPWPMTLQSDGKVIVIYAGTVNRLNPDGSLDENESERFYVLCFLFWMTGARGWAGRAAATEFPPRYSCGSVPEV